MLEWYTFFLLSFVSLKLCFKFHSSKNMNVKIILFFFVAIFIFKRHTCKYFSKSNEDVEYEIVMEVLSCTSLLACAQKCHFKDLDVVYKDGRCYCVIVGKKRNEDRVTEVFTAVKDVCFLIVFILFISCCCSSLI